MPELTLSSAVNVTSNAVPAVVVVTLSVTLGFAITTVDLGNVLAGPGTTGELALLVSGLAALAALRARGLVGLRDAGAGAQIATLTLSFAFLAVCIVNTVGTATVRESGDDPAPRGSQQDIGQRDQRRHHGDDRDDLPPRGDASDHRRDVRHQPHIPVQVDVAPVERAGQRREALPLGEPRLLTGGRLARAKPRRFNPLAIDRRLRAIRTTSH